MSFARMNFGRATLRFGPLRLAVVLLGDRLSGAAIQQTRVDTFVIEAENPAEALRAELDARGLAPRSVALGLARTVVAVKPIDLPSVVGEMREMVRFELDRHLPFPADDAPFDFLTLPPAAGGGGRGGSPPRGPAEAWPPPAGGRATRSGSPVTTPRRSRTPSPHWARRSRARRTRRAPSDGWPRSPRNRVARASSRSPSRPVAASGRWT